MGEQREEVTVITRDELGKKRSEGEPFVLVDVLSHDHFERVHLPGAVNVPLDRIRELAPLLFGIDDEIIVYCANLHCTASPTAAKLLEQIGFTNILDFAGGIQEWLDAGLPVVLSDDLRQEIERKKAA
jgi:rhodanese-related sulfurtransferase